MATNKKTTINRRGFTLVELMLATGIASIVVIGVGVLLVDSQRGWNRMYSRTYSDLVNDAHAARRRFDSVVRNASSQGILLDDVAGSWLEVYYYSDPNVTVVDSYVRFYSSDSGTEKQLMIEYGQLDPKQTLITETICEDVTNCIFKTAGNSAQMILTLDNGSQSTTVVASAFIHNQ